MSSARFLSPVAPPPEPVPYMPQAPTRKSRFTNVIGGHTIASVGPSTDTAAERNTALVFHTPPAQSGVMRAVLPRVSTLSKRQVPVDSLVPALTTPSAIAPFERGPAAFISTVPAVPDKRKPVAILK